MLTVEFPGVGVKPFAPPLVPLPQPERSASPVKTAASSNRSGKPRCFLQPQRHTAAASAVTGSKGRELGREAAARALALMVSWVVAADPEGVTTVGLKA